MRRAIMIAAALALLAAAPGAAAVQPRASLTEIEKQVMCPICGTTLELSTSPQADRERALIRGLIAKGETTQQIKDALVAEYGPAVLATPPKSGFDLTAWIVPIVGLALGAIGIGVALLRWRRAPRAAAAVPVAPEGEQAERLEADLTRYDL
jgi:cytochrome c-type biogenesis protein CcmH